MEQTSAGPDTGRQVLGRWGEDLAAAHLTGMGMVLLARNWRCPHGELDVVARDRDGTIVFVEVKTRSSAAFGEPSEAVGHRKATKVRQLACCWLQQCRPPGRGDLRFDVVSIVRRRGFAPELTHLQAAF